MGMKSLTDKYEDEEEMVGGGTVTFLYQDEDYSCNDKIGTVAQKILSFCPP